MRQVQDKDKEYKKKLITSKVPILLSEFGKQHPIEVLLYLNEVTFFS